MASNGHVCVCLLPIATRSARYLFPGFRFRNCSYMLLIFFMICQVEIEHLHTQTLTQFINVCLSMFNLLHANDTTFSSTLISAMIYDSLNSLVLSIAWMYQNCTLRLLLWQFYYWQFFMMLWQHYCFSVPTIYRSFSRRDFNVNLIFNTNQTGLTIPHEMKMHSCCSSYSADEIICFSYLLWILPFTQMVVLKWI